jgi:hypothetical protein
MKLEFVDHGWLIHPLRSTGKPEDSFVNPLSGLIQRNTGILLSD